MDIVVVRDEEDSEELALSIRSKIDSFEVVDQSSYDAANILNKRAYEVKRSFHLYDDPVHEPITEAWKASCARRKKIDDACDYTIKSTGKKQAAWIRAEEAKAAEKQRKADAIARKAAEDAQIAAAEALQAEGMENAAMAILEAPAVISKVQVAVPYKAEGTSYRDEWAAEVVCLSDLIKAVAAGKAPLNAIQANESYLGSWAKMSKGTESIPGVKVTNTPIQTRRL